MSARLRILILLLATGILCAAAPAALAAAQHPYNLGCKALEDGDLTKAEQLFKKALKLNGRDTDALNNLAVCYIRSAKFEDALPLLDKVLRLNSRYSGADLNIGCAYIFLQDLSKAEPPTKKATGGGKSKSGIEVSASAYYNLGLIAAQDGRLTEAQDALQHSVAIEPTPEARIALGATLCALGELDTGLPMLEEAADEGAGDQEVVSANLAAAYYQRGLEKLGQRDVTGAEQDFVRSSEAVKNDYATLGLALVDAERGNNDEAEKKLTALATSSKSEVIRTAAKTNLTRLQSGAVVPSVPVPSSSSTGTDWMKWVIIAAGALLFGFQAYVVTDVMTSARSRGRGVPWQGIVGIVCGFAAAAFLAILFLDDEPNRLWVAVTLAADAVVVAVVWFTSRSDDGQKAAAAR
jgi:tetratricopeptide (TPR) repeat protein